MTKYSALLQNVLIFSVGVLTCSMSFRVNINETGQQYSKSFSAFSNYYGYVQIALASRDVPEQSVVSVSADSWSHSNPDSTHSRYKLHCTVRPAWLMGDISAIDKATLDKIVSGQT